MGFKNFSYLIITLIAIIIPLLFSFKSGIRNYSKLKYFIPALLFSGTIFMLWNMRFEELGIWRVNPDFIIGKQIFRIPLEEWLFLFAISYFPFIIYEKVKFKFQNAGNPNIYLGISLVLLVIFGLVAFLSREKLYTFFTFFLLTIYFGYTIFRNRFKIFFPKFYVAFLISILPFLIIKSILIKIPVISYENLHTIGIRLFQVPVEDFGHFFLLFLMNVTIFEYLNERHFY